MHHLFDALYIGIVIKSTLKIKEWNLTVSVIKISHIQMIYLIRLIRLNVLNL